MANRNTVEGAPVDVEVIKANRVFCSRIASRVGTPPLSGDQLHFSVAIDIGQRHFMVLRPFSVDIVPHPSRTFASWPLLPPPEAVVVPGPDNEIVAPIFIYVVYKNWERLRSRSG